jgi:hypothetical protein
MGELRAALNEVSRDDASDGMTGATALCQGDSLSDADALDVLRRGLDEALARCSWREVVTLAEAGLPRAARLGAHAQLAGLHEARARGLDAGGHRSDAVAAWRAAVLATPMDEVGPHADRLRKLAEVEWQKGLLAAASAHIEEAALLLTDPASNLDGIRDAVTLTRGLFAGQAPLPTAPQAQACRTLTTCGGGPPHRRRASSG